MKNTLLIVIDSVTNDVLFNKSNSNIIAPFLNKLRKKSISGNKMYSEAPYTEAALMSLLGSVDTMDNGGYMERFKNTKSVFEVFKEHKYSTFFNNYYPTIYPSYYVGGIDEKKYIEGFYFFSLWEYRLEYFSNLYLENKTSKRENKMLEDILEDNFKCGIVYLDKIRNKDTETEMLNDDIDTTDIDKSISEMKHEYNEYKKDKRKYLFGIFNEKENHKIFKIKSYVMNDKVHNDEFKKSFIKKYYYIFDKINKLNIKYNLKNNKYPFKKTFSRLIKGDFKTVKGLLAGYKNSLLDKDLYERIGINYDTVKNQRSFYTVSDNFEKWLDNNNKTPWVSYIHIDDAHYRENFFTYDTTDMNQLDKEFNRINNYLDSLPKDYSGSIAYDLSLLYCDSVIDKIFNMLKKKKILDNTNIIITADHGFSYYFNPIREKYVISSYNENYNVPFIVYGPKIKPRLIEGFCSTKDIPSTLLGMNNIKIPNCFKGNNLLETNGEKYSLLEYTGGGCPDVKRRPIILGVRTENYNVVLDIYISKSFEKKVIKEVYNLKKDKYENNNIANKKNIEKEISYEISILKEKYDSLRGQYMEYLNEK